MKLKIAVVDLDTGEIYPPEPMRAEQGWNVAELKQCIGEVSIGREREGDGDRGREIQRQREMQRERERERRTKNTLYILFSDV